jgi:long-chain acyl-CoA synthetase
MFVRLLRLPPDERARYDIGTLRHVLHTGAPCRPQVKHDMIDWLGPVIWEQYGSTETGVAACAIRRNGSRIRARSDGRS